jgi:hypothetical protein
MKRLIPSTMIVFLMALSVLSCKNDKITSTWERSEDPQSLAFWHYEEDSVNHGFVEVAEILWRFDKDSDSLDIDDLGYRLAWYEKSEKALVHCFDSIHPNAKLSEAEKADSMLNELETFFEQFVRDDDAQISYKSFLYLRHHFTRFRCLALSHAILEKDTTFRKEMEAWESVHKEMKTFCNCAIHAIFYGGSIIGLEEVVAVNAIYDRRRDDLARVYSLCQNESLPCNESKNPAKAKAILLKSIEKTISKIEPREEYSYDKREKQEFDSLCYKVQPSRKTLLVAIENWLKTREQLSLSNSNTGKKRLDQSSSMLIEDFAKIMEEVCDVRVD